ncbi:MAG: tetratricopeptide repeat protein [Treponema sp.]|nr:tetratricopeptide repeat protein [Treponema sp.]
MENSVLSDGISLYVQNKFSDALAFFLALPEDSGADNFELAYYIGLCYARLEKYDDALMYIEQVVTGGKDYQRVLQCRYLLAIIYVKSGRKRLADFELNKLLETGYKSADVLASLAFISWENRDIDKCLEYYERSLEKDSENVTALNGMGYVLAEEGRELTRALGYCKKALNNAPQNAACLDSLGWVYYKLGLLEEAGKYLKQAEEKLPENVEIQKHLNSLANARTDHR